MSIYNGQGLTERCCVSLRSCLIADDSILVVNTLIIPSVYQNLFTVVLDLYVTIMFTAQKRKQSKG